MIGTVLLSIIPYIPGPTLTWAIGIVYAVVVQPLPVPALVVMTLLMAAGATSDFWLPLFGVRVRGLSCLGAVGSLIGGVVGTFLIPVPIFGTLIGSVAGAMLVEFGRLRELRQAMQAGSIVVKLYIIGAIVQFCFSLAIFLAFALAIAAIR